MMNNKTVKKLYEEHVGKTSDKWSLYINEYDRIFRSYQNKDIYLLEIGVQNGGSLDIWAKYFFRAKKLVGCDINPECVKLSYKDKRIVVVIGDANLDITQNNILEHTPIFDVIIDDGSHRSGNVIKSFARYFPNLADDGVFIVEDLHCSYWSDFEGGIFYPFSSVAFFKRLADVINHEHWSTNKSRINIFKGFFLKYGFQISEETLQHVHSVEFINSMCIIKKSEPKYNLLGNRVIVGMKETLYPEQTLHPSYNKTPNQTKNTWTSRETTPDEESVPLCSVVIPTKNGGELFLKVLNALVNQTIWKNVELIVVDSGSNDDTVNLAKLAGAKVIEISPKEFNHGLTRDLGISRASTENIILMVQDAVPKDSKMIETLLFSLVKNNNVAGVYARQIPQENADIITKRNLNQWLTSRVKREERSIPYEGWYDALSPMEKYQFCNFDNVCSAIRKSVWEIESFGNVKFGEDIDWAERVLKRGYKIIYEPYATVLHSHSRSLVYEHKRTYVCHLKLYKMFGLHLVRNIKELIISWIHSSSTDIVYIFKNERRLIQKIKMVLKVPVLNFLNVLAQYWAVKDLNRGTSKSIHGV